MTQRILPRVLVRAPFLIAIAALLVTVGMGSSLLRLVTLAPGVVFLLLAGAIALALVPALLTPRSPLPVALAVSVPVLGAAAYDESRLDWLRLLKDFGVVAGHGPSWARLVLSLLVLALAWAMHAADHAARLRWSALERGIPAVQARAAMRVALVACARVGALALAGAAAVGALAWGASFLDADRFLGGESSLLAPLLAVVLIGAAAVLLTRSGPTEE